MYFRALQNRITMPHHNRISLKSTSLAGEPTNSIFSQLSPVIVFTGLFFLNFSSRMMLSPLTPVIEKELGLSHSGAGSLFFMITLGYLIALLSSGFVASKLTHRQTILLSNTGLGIVLLFTGLVAGRWGLRLELFFLGLMTGFYLPSGMATITDIVPVKRWGLALSIHELAPNVGFVLVPVIAELVLLRYSWQSLFTGIGVAVLFTSLMFYQFGRGGNIKGVAPSLPMVKTIISNRSFWIMSVLFLLGVSSAVGVYTMLPLYLVNEHGWERQWANSIVSASRVAGIFMPFLAGWITDRHGPEKILRGIFLLMALTTALLGIVPNRWILPMVFLQPLFSVSFFPVGFAALSRICMPKERSLTISLAITLSFLFGAGFVPYLIGVIGDAGRLSWGFVLVGGANLLGIALPAYLKYKH